MNQKQIVVNNLLLTYYFTEALTPKEGAPILLFLHGWRSESAVWSHIMSKMSEMGYNCIALDMPGFGKSEVPKDIFNTDRYAETVEAFIEKIGAKDLIGIGHSYGGRVLMNISINKKFEFKKIVLVDSSGVDIDNGKVDMFKTIAKIVKPLFKPKFMKPLRARIYNRIGASDYIAAETSESSGFFKETYLNVTKDNYNESLSMIDAQALIIWGLQDQETPVRMAEILNRNIRGSTLKVIDGAGHYVFLDQPKEFLDAVSKFVN